MCLHSLIGCVSSLACLNTHRQRLLQPKNRAHASVFILSSLQALLGLGCVALAWASLGGGCIDMGMYEIDHCNDMGLTVNDPCFVLCVGKRFAFICLWGQG